MGNCAPQGRDGGSDSPTKEWRPPIFLLEGADDAMREGGEDTAPVFTQNTCKNGFRKSSLTTEVFRDDMIFTYNVTARDCMRLAMERLHHKKDKEYQNISNEEVEDFSAKDTEMAEELEEQLSSTVSFSDKLYIGKKHMMRFRLRLSVLGVDGLPKDRFGERGMSDLKCRISMRKDGNILVPMYDPESNADIKNISLDFVSPRDDPKNKACMRFSYGNPKRTDIHFSQPICDPRWCGEVLVEIVSKTDDDVVASFRLNPTIFDDYGLKSCARYCSKRTFPSDGSIWSDSNSGYPRGVPEDPAVDKTPRLYLRLWHEFEDESIKKYMAELIAAFDESVAYLTESRDSCIEACEHCEETGVLKFKTEIGDLENNLEIRKAIRVRSIDGVIEGLRLTQEVFDLVRMGLEKAKHQQFAVSQPLLRRIKVATIVLKVRHLRFWAEHAPKGWFSYDAEGKDHSDAPIHPGWISMTYEVRAGFMLDAFLSYSNSDIRGDVRALIGASGKGGPYKSILAAWECNANIFAALNASELVIALSRQVKDAAEGKQRKKFMEKVAFGLRMMHDALREAMSSFHDLNHKKGETMLDQKLLQESKQMAKSGLLVRLLATVGDKLDRESYTYSEDMHQNLISLKEAILDIPAAEDENCSFHELVTQLDTGREHAESKLDIPAVLWGAREGEGEDRDDGSFVHLQQREEYEEVDDSRRVSAHRSRSVLLSRYNLSRASIVGVGSDQSRLATAASVASDDKLSTVATKSDSEDAPEEKGATSSGESKSKIDLHIPSLVVDTKVASSLGPPATTPPGAGLRTPLRPPDAPPGLDSGGA
eukprot:g1424.t1